MTVQVTTAPSFLKELRKLPPDRQRGAAKGLGKFIKTPELPGLDFRSLAGHPGYYIIDPHGGDRIILRKIADDHYEAVDVGPHDNIYRRWNRK